MTKKSKESKSYLSTATTSKMWRIQTETNLMKTEDRPMRISSKASNAPSFQTAANTRMPKVSKQSLMIASPRIIRISWLKISKNSSKLRTIRFALSLILWLWTTWTNRILKVATIREFKRQRRMPIKLSQLLKSLKSKKKTCSKSFKKPRSRKSKCREHSARSQTAAQLKSQRCSRRPRNQRRSEHLQGMSIFNKRYQESDKKAIGFI